MNHRSPDWEPEPLRWLGARFVQLSMMRLDRLAERHEPGGADGRHALAGHRATIG